MKRIAQLMTPQPWTVQIDDSIAVARQMMVEREIHHLPVLDGQKVAGIVTQRELARISDRASTVARAMISVPRVAPDTPVEDVLDTMIDERSDAIVVTRENTVEGIFTATDAVRALRELMRARHR